MKKLNKNLCWGVFLNGKYIISNRFNLLPDFIEGLALGLGILCILLSMCSERYDISKIKNYKKSLLKLIATK